MRLGYVAVVEQKHRERSKEQNYWKVLWMHTDNMGIMEGLWRGKEGCFGPKQKDADSWVNTWGILCELCGKELGPGCKVRQRTSYRKRKEDHVHLSQSHLVNCPTCCAEGRVGLFHLCATSHHLIFFARHCSASISPVSSGKDTTERTGQPSSTSRANSILPRATKVGKPGFSEFLVNPSWISKHSRPTRSKMRLTLQGAGGTKSGLSHLVRMNKRIFTQPIPPPTNSFVPPMHNDPMNEVR